MREIVVCVWFVVVVGLRVDGRHVNRCSCGGLVVVWVAMALAGGGCGKWSGEWSGVAREVVEVVAGDGKVRCLAA